MRLSLRQRVLYATAFIIFIVSAGVFCTLSLLNTIRPAGLIIHHSAIPPRADGRQIDAGFIDEIHRARGFSAFYWGRVYHIGYHYIILPDGTVQQGRPEHCQGAHTAGYNSYIGICLVGDFSTADNPNGERGLTEPTEAQMRALTDLCRNLRQKYQIPLPAVFRHSDVNPNTECPGDRFPYREFLKRLESSQDVISPTSATESNFWRALVVPVTIRYVPAFACNSWWARATIL